jgi:HK97 family phage major capsid protein
LAGIEELLRSLDESAKRLAEQRSPSRYAAPGASEEHVRYVASLASKQWTDDGYEVEPPPSGLTEHRSGAAFLRDIAAARFGDGRAAARLSKAWVEGTPGAGGFLVNPQTLPSYVAAMRASAPLRARCTQIDARSDEVWIVCEGDSVEVTHTAEGATKLDTSGTIAQKISTVFKVAGTSHVSDELLADSNGNVEELVSSQFGKAIGIEIDSAIISGTGTGQPTGIRNAAGVNAQDVDGQDGQALFESILKAIHRIAQRFEPVDTVVVHPRDTVKVDLATASGSGEYLFPGGLSAALPDGVDLVLDANLPSSLGAGTDETVILVGGFKRGGYFFSRQPLTVDASRHAGWTTDETVFRGVERHGFAVVVPGAFEILTGITP